MLYSITGATRGDSLAGVQTGNGIRLYKLKLPNERSVFIIKATRKQQR